MAFEHLSNITSEERQAAKEAAQKERQRIIQEAINNGATIQYITAPLSGDEMETHINISSDNTVIIDTTISSDIRKFIDGGWKITAVTYYEDRVCGITCKADHRRGITIRTLT